MSHGRVSFFLFPYTVVCVLFSGWSATISTCPRDLWVCRKLHSTLVAYSSNWPSVSLVVHATINPFVAVKNSHQIFRNDKTFLNRFLHICILLPPFCRVACYRHRDLSVIVPPLDCFPIFWDIFRFRRIYIVSRLSIGPCYRCKRDRDNFVDTLHVETFNRHRSLIHDGQFQSVIVNLELFPYRVSVPFSSSDPRLLFSRVNE